MEEEKQYPIYRFWASWNQKDYKNNGTGFTKMYEVEPTQLELEEDMKKFQDGIISDHEEVEWLDTGFKFVEFETWCSKWFSHMTFNKFNNDMDTINSFALFVQRKLDLNIKNGHYGSERNDENKNPFYCFMGAEDRYRWEVCHCEFCEKSNWIIMNH